MHRITTLGVKRYWSSTDTVLQLHEPQTNLAGTSTRTILLPPPRTAPVHFVFNFPPFNPDLLRHSMLNTHRLSLGG